MHRVVVLVAIFLAWLSPATGPRSAAAGGPDLSRLVRQGTALAGHDRTAALSYFRRHGLHPELGLDGRTITVRVGGREIAILPSSVTTQPLRRHGLSSRLRRQDTPTSRRAIVLEPFATELDLGSNAGVPEVQALQSLGYTVTALRDSAVSLATMATLAQYSVVYMETHSGVLSSGDAVVATAQTDTTGLDALFHDGSVIQVTVAGDPTKKLYIGITGKYVTQHLNAFPTRSLVYLNGCAVLAAPLFWSALQARGVSTLVSWDHDAIDSTEDEAARLVFEDLAAGNTVVTAVNAARANGLGTSFVDGTQARLGFLGAGSLTLAAPAVLPADTPTATPTATSVARTTHRRHRPPCTHRRKTRCRRHTKKRHKGG
ncbi:MAG TPA: hypothetical protein VFB58_01780 [Chloroflexota bacterium]|nr:hypothetical protein [Chloroflexota bacterium]